MSKISVVFFIVIIALAALLRLYQLGNVPASPDWDEVSLGYNAYSILNTGKDEYGAFLPVVLRSFDDYKPALYAYFIIPFIFLFDLSVIAVRMPSALFGILTVIATYFLVKELFNNKIALLTSFLLAISPWHIQFSRIGFESNVGMAFNVFTLLFFLKGLKNSKFLPLSFFLGATNIYIYQSEKVFTPLMFLMLFIVFWKELFINQRDFLLKFKPRYMRWITISFVVAIIISIPMMISIFGDKNSLLRAKGVSIFSDKTQFLKETVEKVQYDQQTKNYLGLLLDNRRIEYGKAIIAGYISHFDLNWLFITGDIARHHAQNMGLLYLFELPFLFIGMYALLFSKEFDKRVKLVIFSYFLLVPIPASITSGVPHSVRTLNFLPMLQIFIALGILRYFKMLSNFKFKYIVYGLAFLFFAFNFIYYLNQYFVQMNYYTSADWQYGYKEAVAFVNPIKQNYDKIYVSNQQPLDQSYMFFLFYSKYDPKKYQEEGGTESGGFREKHRGFANFTFEPIDWVRGVDRNALYIGSPSDFPSNAKVLKTIHFLNGKEAIKIAER